MEKVNAKTRKWHAYYWDDIQENTWLDVIEPKKPPIWKNIQTTPYILLAYEAPDRDGKLRTYWMRGRFNFVYMKWMTEASKNHLPRAVTPIKMMIISGPLMNEAQDE